MIRPVLVPGRSLRANAESITRSNVRELKQLIEKHEELEQFREGMREYETLAEKTRSFTSAQLLELVWRSSHFTGGVTASEEFLSQQKAMRKIREEKEERQNEDNDRDQ